MFGEGSYYLQMQQVNIPPTSRFFSAMINSNACPDRIGAMALYRRYVDYHEASRYRFPKTIAAFGRILSDLDGVQKEHASTGTVYRFDAPSLRMHLVTAKEYDEDASLT